MNHAYDLIIIGAGPAGLAAGLYGARAKLNTLLLEKAQVGGQIVTTEAVANYPGAPEETTGPSLVARMRAQAEAFGAEIKKETVLSVDLTGKIKKIQGEAEVYLAKTVLIATGASPQKIGCSGEAALTGKGVSYCATCDADFFTDLEVFVIGGGDTAVEEAMYLTKFARKVFVVHRRDQLRAAKSIQDKAFSNPKLSFIWDTVVEEIKGDGIVQSIVLKNVKTGEKTQYDADEDDGTMGIFPFIGFQPCSDLFKGKINMDADGYIIAGEDMRTDVAGVFVAGDVRAKKLRQAVTAAADGAVAAVMAEAFILDMEA